MLIDVQALQDHQEDVRDGVVAGIKLAREVIDTFHAVDGDFCAECSALGFYGALLGTIYAHLEANCDDGLRAGIKGIASILKLAPADFSAEDISRHVYLQTQEQHPIPAVPAADGLN